MQKKTQARFRQSLVQKITDTLHSPAVAGQSLPPKSGQAAGLSTSVLTPMRFIAEKMRTPRALYADFPLGQLREVHFQRRVLLAACAVVLHHAGFTSIASAQVLWVGGVHSRRYERPA